MKRTKFTLPLSLKSSPPPRLWVWILLSLALLVRLWMLGEKPAHFDEGVNGWFLDRMFEKFAYNYDPENYHGPLHFYLTIPFIAALGPTEFALRLPAVLFSVATVWLLTRFYPLVGTIPSLLAALLFALSPGALFYSRYGIHESALAFFVTLFGLSVLMLWTAGASRWLVLSIVSVAGAVATKETFFMNMVPLVIATACVWILASMFRNSSWDIPQKAKGEWSWALMLVTGAVSLAVLEVLYNGFGDYPGWGLGKFVDSYTVWSKTAEAGAGHVKSSFDLWSTPLNYYWVYLLWIYEWPVIAGMLLTIPYWGRIGPAARVITVWGFGVVLAYSIVPYKTPWCILSMLPPLCLAASSGLWHASSLVPGHTSRLAVVAVFAMTITPRSLILNYRDYDKQGEPYVYVQTSRESLLFMDELRRAEQMDPRVIDLPAAIALGSYYPLPWWLNKYKRIEYTKDGLVPSAKGKAWVLVPWSRKDEFLKKNPSQSWRIARFKLREAQEDVAACLNAEFFPAPGKFVHPPPTLQ